MMPELLAVGRHRRPGADFNVRQVPGETAVPCFWGRDTTGACLFIVELQGDHTVQYRKNAVTVNGINVDLRGGEPGQQRSFSLSRNRSIATSSRSLPHARIQRWSAPPIPPVRSPWRWRISGDGRPSCPAVASILSAEEVRGLFAELTFLLELIDRLASTTAAVEAWLGPEKSHQDFIFGNTAVEIKSLSGTERSTVRISSEDQLESLNDALFLRIYRLSSLPDAARAQSLNEIVAAVQTRLAEAEAIEAFDRKLVAHGYAPLPDYDGPRFVVSDAHSYRVGDGFPRLIRSQLPTGIAKVAYDIRLETIAPFECDGAAVFGGN